MLCKAIYAVFIVIVTMGGASAQADLKSIQGGQNSLRSEQEKKNDRAIDRDYQSTIKRLPTQQENKSDPWGDVRPTSPAVAKNKQ